MSGAMVATMTAAILACLIPALKAVRVDPVKTLQAE